MRKGRSGVTLVEVLIASGILAVSLLPVLGMTSRNLQQVEVDRYRLVGESLCHNALARFGRFDDDVARLMTPSASGDTLEVADVWNVDPGFRDQVADPATQEMIRHNNLHMEMILQQDVSPNVHQLTIKVSWTRPVRHDRESVTRVRLILHD